MGKSLIIIYVVCVIFSGCEKERIQQDYQYKVIGETITLTGLQWNELWKRNVTNVKLYKIEPNGMKIVYQQDQDYIVQGNRIKRTLNSRIKDFDQHKVVYDEKGKFKWVPAPNCNPELTLPYQIYVDYNYAENPIMIQKNKFLSSNILEKLQSNQMIKIVVSGTSVTYGMDTYERYYNNSDIQHILI